jgi:hypothetical protein
MVASLALPLHGPPEPFTSTNFFTEKNKQTKKNRKINTIVNKRIKASK